MMTAEKLKAQNARDLAQLAKRKGVSGWHGMTKDQLVKALLQMARSSARRAPTSRAATKSTPAKAHGAKVVTTKKLSGKPVIAAKNGKAMEQAKSSAAGKSQVAKPAVVAKAEVAKPRPVKPVKVAPPPDPRVLQRINRFKNAQERGKNLAHNTPPNRPGGYTRDRLVVMVRDPYWLHAYWELTRQSVERAQAAMAGEWHTCRPVLRLLRVHGTSTTSSSETVVRNIEIHGGVNNWYVDVHDPPKNFRLEIGYLAAGGRFYCLARSNMVSTPRAGASDAIDENWTDVAQNAEKIYAMSANPAGGCSTELQELFEERLRRPMGSPMMTRFGTGADGALGRERKFNFELDAELIVFGATEPGAHVTLQGDPVKLRPDGTFTVRYSLPNCRQVIPAVASSIDGAEQRTVVLAVERNTKVMEPLVRDADE
ncbi:MAG: DUF4912 domain-containing protein [Pirellulales bacterium]|nr:DUF4912 domain-containing protein [Pirellulales bacterium]